MSRPFRTDPDRIDGNETVINDFRGLNTVMPLGILGQPSVLENVILERIGGYTGVPASLFFQDTNSQLLNAVAWDNNETIFVKKGSDIGTFNITLDFLTVRITPYVLNEFVNLAPQVVLARGSQIAGLGYTLASQSWVLTRDGQSQPWYELFVGLTPITYTPPDVALGDPLSTLDQVSWMRPNSPNTISPIGEVPTIGAFPSEYPPEYPEGSRVGWSVSNTSTGGVSYFLVFFKDKRIPDAGLLNPASLPPQKLIPQYRIASGNITIPQHEFAIPIDHSPDLEVIVYGAAYPATRRLYKGGSGTAIVPDAFGLPPAGTVCVANTVYTFGIILDPVTQEVSKRLNLLCLTGGTIIARTAAQNAAFKAAYWDFGSTYSDTGGVVWQVVNDQRYTTAFYGFEELIKYITFPPVGWLKELPDWLNSLPRIEAQWGRLDTVSLRPYRTLVYRNLHVDQTEFPIASPREPKIKFSAHHQFRVWCVATELLNFSLNGNSPTEISDRELTVLYSEIDKPWDFRGRFIIPNFRRSSKTTALNGVGNVLIIHGDADAAGLYGNSEANFQSQHLDIPGCANNDSACVFQDRYYWYNKGEIYRLEGAAARSLTAGQILLPDTEDCQITIDHKKNLIYFCFNGNKIFIFNVDFDAWSERTIPSPSLVYPKNICKIPLWGDGTPFNPLKKLTGLPVDVMKICFSGLDGGNAASRKRWAAIHFRAEGVTATTALFGVGLQIDNEPDAQYVGTNNFAGVYTQYDTLTDSLPVRRIYHRLRNKQGHVSNLWLTCFPASQQIVIRPALRLEVTKQGDGRYEH